MTGLRLAALALVLSGCASLSPEECATADWREVGFQDGARGRTPARLPDHAKACAKAGVAPDAPAWEAGRRAGLETYCTPETGLEAGLSGAAYRDVCRPEQEAAFLPAYRRGREIYELREEIRETENDLHDLYHDDHWDRDRGERRAEHRRIDWRASHLRWRLRSLYWRYDRLIAGL